MATLLKEQYQGDEKEKRLFQQLDKGIDDMEQGKTAVHEEVMQSLREKVFKITE